MRNILPPGLFSFSYSSCCRTSSRSFSPKESRSLSSSTDSSSLFSLSSSSTGRASYKNKKVLTFKSYMCTNPPLFFLTKDFNFSLCYSSSSFSTNRFHCAMFQFIWTFFKSYLMFFIGRVLFVNILWDNWPDGVVCDSPACKMFADILASRSASLLHCLWASSSPCPPRCWGSFLPSCAGLASCMPAGWLSAVPLRDFAHFS